MVKQLTKLHGNRLVCGPGCSNCCVNFAVFPVEFYAILSEMKETGLAPDALSFAESSSCGFLSGGLCIIYPFRPIICRTHGLPILYIDDSSGEVKWEVSFCELNFSGESKIEFSEHMLLDIEKINAELYRINQDFIASHDSGQAHNSKKRIPLGDLAAQGYTP